MTGWALCRWVKPGISVVGVRLGLGQQRALQAEDLLDRAVAGGAHPEAEVERHLVVARAGGVQPPGRRRRSAPSSRFSTFMWMSSNSSRNGKVPAAISASIVGEAALDRRLVRRPR